MSPEVIATVLTGAGVLLGVWRMVESVRREVHETRRDLIGQITAVNTRIGALANLARPCRRVGSSRAQDFYAAGC